MTLTSGLLGGSDPGGNEGLDRVQPQRPAGSIVDLNVHLSIEERETLAHRIYYEICRYNAFVETRRGNLERWRRDWELFPTGRSRRWRGAADVPAPLVHIYCNNHHTRLNQQIVKAIPPFTAVAKTPRALELASDIEEAMTSRLEDAEWEMAADEVHSELPIAGNVCLRVTYEQVYTHSPRHQFKLDESNYALLLAAGEDPNDALWESFEKDEEGNLQAFLGWEDILTYSGVKFKTIPWEDFIIIPATVRDPEDAYGIGERLMIRGEELQRGVRDGKYLEDEVEKILETTPASFPQDRIERYDVQGINPTSVGPVGSPGARDPVYDDHLCYELCWKMDTKGDGKMKWCLITLHWQTKTIIRLQYLAYEHGEPYYHLFRYFPRVRELLGMGVAEKLATFQDAGTAILNQIIDHADLALNLFGNFFYDSTSGFDPNKFELQLGKPIKVDSVEGIKPIDIQPLPAEHYQIYQLFKEIGDLVTSTSNPTLGKVTEASKTLGEVQLVAAASGQQFEEVASRVARTWAKVWDQCRKLEAQYAADGIVEFRRKIAPAGDVLGAIPREVLLEEIRLVPTGLKQLSDMQSRVQQATIVQNTLLAHPLTMGNVEVLLTVLDVYLQSVNYVQREKVMEAVYRQVNMQRQMEAMMAQQGMMNGAPPGGQPALPPGEAPPGSVPENPNAPPQPSTHSTGPPAQQLLRTASQQTPFQGG